MGYCPGIENYSRHLSGREEGERPAVLIDFFPERFLMFIDESHVTVPQVRGMYEGDRARKLNLVRYGFRLPSALDNRPLYFAEFERMIDRVVFVSATPGQEEQEKSEQLVEQVIRPTGLLDPELEVRPTEGQIEDLYAEIRKRIQAGERTLVTTLTKRMAEDLAEYLSELGLKVRYLHSEVETIERVEILRDLRLGEFDVLVGINLLREGLDLPEVSLIGILDADKIGFLRSATSLIQTIGRAARHLNGRVIMYADRVSDAMKAAIDETERRRRIQAEYNRVHGITPISISKSVQDLLVRHKEEKQGLARFDLELIEQQYNVVVPQQRQALIKRLEEEMLELAKDLEFERAAVLRDEIQRLKEMKAPKSPASRAPQRASKRT
jgi:excinuclease ABC subunit B